MPNLKTNDYTTDRIPRGQTLSIVCTGSGLLETFIDTSAPIKQSFGATTVQAGFFEQDVTYRLTCFTGEINTSLAPDKVGDSTVVRAEVDPVTGGVSLAFGSTALQLLGKQKPTRSTNLLIPGDSLGVGAGLSSSANRFGTLIATAKSLTETNVAVGGSVVERYNDQQTASNALYAGDTVCFISGYNNVRYGGTTEANVSSYVTSLCGLLAHLGLPDSKKVFSQINSSTLNTAQYTFGGTWAASSNGKGSLAQSRAGATSVTPASYAETTVTGDTVYIMLGGQNGFATKVFITIDGVRFGSAGKWDVSPEIAIPDGGGQVPNPVVLRIPGLSSGTHTVRVTHAGAGGQYIWFGWIAGFNASDRDLPVVYVAGPPLMTAAGYAQAGLFGTPTVSRTYQEATRRCCKAISADGLLVQYVDIDADIKISTDIVSVDTVHPLEMWHKIAAQCFIAEINKPFVLN